MLRALLAALLASARATDMHLVMLPTDTYNATCSDGSPVGYYWRGAPKGSKNKDKVVLWLKGGDFCESHSDCVARQAKPGLGSSKAWPKTYYGNGIQSPVEAENPDFFDWAHVYLEYCSGDLWTGTQVEPVNPWPGSGPENFTFAGHSYLTQVVDHLEKVTHGVIPSDFILTGGSAGGFGTFVNADWMGEHLTEATKYRAMPQGGFFGHPYADWAHFKTNTTDPEPYHRGMSEWLANIERYTPPAEGLCVAHNASLGLECGSPLYMYPFTTTRMFLAQAAVDFEQVFEHSGAPAHDVFTNPTIGAYVHYQHAIQAGNLKDVVVHGRKAATDGLFAPACLGHTLPQLGWSGVKRVPNIDPCHPGGKVPHGIAGEDPTVDGMYAAKAFGDWYFDRTTSHMHLDASDDLATLCKCNPHICGPRK